jgi:hypothetical protein
MAALSRRAARKIGRSLRASRHLPTKAAAPAPPRLRNCQRDVTNAADSRKNRVKSAENAAEPHVARHLQNRRHPSHFMSRSRHETLCACGFVRKRT